MSSGQQALTWPAALVGFPQQVANQTGDSLTSNRWFLCLERPRGACFHILRSNTIAQLDLLQRQAYPPGLCVAHSNFNLISRLLGIHDTCSRCRYFEKLLVWAFHLTMDGAKAIHWLALLRRSRKRRHLARGRQHNPYYLVPILYKPSINMLTSMAGSMVSSFCLFHVTRNLHIGWSCSPGVITAKHKAAIAGVWPFS